MIHSLPFHVPLISRNALHSFSTFCLLSLPLPLHSIFQTHPRYLAAHDAASEVALSFQSLLVGRRTIDEFDSTQVDDDVLKRAVQCAIAAPNRACTEPWRFIRVGKQTISKFAELNAQFTKQTADDEHYIDWTNAAPGWCVVTARTQSALDNDGEDGVEQRADLQ